MEQIIITEKPIIIISPTTTQLMKKKRMMTNKEELNILIEQHEQHRAIEEQTEEEQRLQEVHDGTTRERMIEKRVKLNVKETNTTKSLRKSLNAVVKKKINNNKRRRGEMNESSSQLSDEMNVSEMSALEMNGSNICCFSLLSSCASLQETNNNNSSALSQISTSFSNLDDEPLLLSSSPSNTTTTSATSSACCAKPKLSATDCCSNEDEECMSSHFLSSKALSDIDEDEINEDDDLKNNNYNNSSSSNCPIPNITISQEVLSSCPLQAGHQLNALSSTTICSSSTIVDTLECETANKSQVKVSITNSASFMNREHTKKWSQDETLKFYKGLELFGTDFSMISRLFTNRTRKMCKNKFRKEEKVNMNEIERRLICNRTLRMKKVVQRLNVIRAKLNLKFASTTEQRIQIITNARRSRLDSFNSIDSLDINVVETIESQLNGQPLF